ncbi:hypothetical protein KJ966_11630 [bacterium]|nr:hypothetical protein [bacterium]
MQFPIFYSRPIYLNSIPEFIGEEFSTKGMTDMIVMAVNKMRKSRESELKD